MEENFNDTLKIFIPKSSDNVDADPGTVTPEKTRPFGLKNTDNKAISGVTNFSIRQSGSVPEKLSPQTYFS